MIQLNKADFSDRIEYRRTIPREGKLAMRIYEGYYDTMADIMRHLVEQIEANSRRHEAAGGEKLFEHLNYRIKGEDSMREKLQRRGLEPTARNALREVTDAIGLRVVCLFIDDVYENVALRKIIRS